MTQKRESAGHFSLMNWLNLSLQNLLHVLETTVVPYGFLGAE
jgi:hypothetical protein